MTTAQSQRTTGASGRQTPESATGVPTRVTVSNFIRAETDLYFSRTAFGRFGHRREMAEIDKQDVVRMNRDTLYSSAVFDLDAGPVTITLPDPGKRFMSLMVLSEDHYAIDVVYAPGRHTYTKDQIGTRYVCLAIRTFSDPRDPNDMQAAHALQDAITIEQANAGTFEIPNWDLESQAKVREALEALAKVGLGDGAAFGRKGEVDPVRHLISTAIGWGGNPRTAAVYEGVFPKANDGETVHALTVKDVPVDGFWSVSVYNEKGYFEKNGLDAYSVNNLTAAPNADGSVTVQFGGCRKGLPNCLPIMPGWNYTVRLYRPRKEIIDGTWNFPEARPV
jgi:hypothetical protein